MSEDLTPEDVATSRARARYGAGADPVVSELLSVVDSGAEVEGFSESSLLGLAADVLTDAGRITESLALHRRSLAAAGSESERAEALLGIGRALLADRRFPEADASFRQAFQLNGDTSPDSDLALRMCGVSAVQFALAGARDLALSWLGTALELAGPEPGLEVRKQRMGIHRELGIAEDDMDRRTQADCEAEDEAQPAARLRRAGRPLILWWPYREYHQLARWLPAEARRYGATWEDHRQQIEYRLRTEASLGRPAALCPALAVLLSFYLELAWPPALTTEVADDFAAYCVYVRGYTAWAPRPRNRCGGGRGSRNRYCCARR